MSLERQIEEIREDYERENKDLEIIIEDYKIQISNLKHATNNIQQRYGQVRK